METYFHKRRVCTSYRTNLECRTSKLHHYPRTRQEGSRAGLTTIAEPLSLQHPRPLHYPISLYSRSYPFPIQNNELSLQYQQPSVLPNVFTAMLYIHRSFFAQALLDFPANPLRSPFAPSFLAAYRCASVTIKTTALNFQMYPELFTRWWAIWSHLLSAAVCNWLGPWLILNSAQVTVGSIVTRAPSSTMAPAAWEELNLAVDVFSRGSEGSRRARHGLVRITQYSSFSCVHLYELTGHPNEAQGKSLSSSRTIP